MSPETDHGRTHGVHEAVMRRHVFFLVRYSILTTKHWGWKLAHQPPDEYRQALFSEDRLAFRSWLFETLAAPSIARNAFSGELPCSTLILTSKELPSLARARVEAIAERIPGAEIVSLKKASAYPEKQARKAVEARLRKFEEETLFATVQLDDDDVLSPSFLSMLSSYVDRPFRGHAVSFARGYVGELNRQDRAFDRFRHLYAPKLFLGLAYINSYDPGSGQFHDPSIVTVYGLGRHRAIDEKRPTIVSAQTPAWIRTCHGDNDRLPGTTSNDGGDRSEVAGSRPWYHYLTTASLDEVLSHFRDYDLPIGALVELQEGTDVTGRIRFESEAGVCRRMLEERHTGGGSRRSMLGRIAKRIERLGSRIARRLMPPSGLLTDKERDRPAS